MIWVVDASVTVRWYVSCPDSDAAVALLRSNEPLIAPDLVVAEVVNVAWKLVRAKQITHRHGAQIADAAPSAFSRLVPGVRLASRAFAIARQLDHPVYDCLYIALAEIEKARLVTSDQRLLKTVASTRWHNLVEDLGRWRDR